MSTITFKIPGIPIAKQRHRMANGHPYDPQDQEKKSLRWILTQDLQKRHLNPLEGAIGASLDILYPIPASWSKKRQENAIHNYVMKKPDTDNFIKFYFDVLNGVAYNDDAQIAEIFATKRYSYSPSVTIDLYPLEGNVINEHAITYQESLTLENLNYIIKKANRLGLRDRQLLRVFQEEDSEGKHIYFEVEALKGKSNG